MTLRAAAARKFLSASGWNAAQAHPLAGDASSRTYSRLVMPGRTAVFMDAPPPDGPQSTARFVRTSAWLTERGYSSPDVMARDDAQGFLLLEDLGDDVFTLMAAKHPSLQTTLYAAAIGLLADIGRQKPPEFLRVLDGPGLADLLSLTSEWFLPSIGAGAGVFPSLIREMVILLHSELCIGPPVVSLRDFHAGNLIWLPDRPGLRRCGLLDFQDAVSTHPAYDVVSLLQDARRDVPPDVEEAMILLYARLTGADPATFRPVYAFLGAQRALRILGVFARLARVGGKPDYLNFVPRVWANLQRSLLHPALAAMKQIIDDAMPRMTERELAHMRSEWAIPGH